MVSIGHNGAPWQFSKLLVRAATTVSENATSTTKSKGNPTIAEFATALNGVDQPMDNTFKIVVWSSLGVLATLILIIRLVQRAKAHIRHVSTMNLSGEQQKYWSKNSTKWWRFKKYVLYAPLGKKRHNMEIKIFKSLTIGTVPSRFHTILLVAFILSNIIFCFTLHYRHNQFSTAAELRGRSGVLALINMIALIIFAGRNNPLIPLLQISFDTYNLFHRWIGRVIVIEVIIHTCAWAYVKHAATGWSGVIASVGDSAFIGWGTVGAFAMILISILSLSPLRHAFYETFLNVHIILALLAVIGTWVHCDLGHLSQFIYIKVVFILWILERVARMARIVWCNYRKREWTVAIVEALPQEACRVTLRLPKKVKIKPGSHAYLRFAKINAWESHPFSIAWVDHLQKYPTLPTTEKYPGSPSSIQARAKDGDIVTEVSFVIQAHSGLTRRLFFEASANKPHSLTLKAALEGPYGGHHSLDSYGHVVLFAGSTGITHQIPFVRHLVDGYNKKSVATRKIVLVWIVRDNDQLEWVRPWMDTILQMPGRRECVNIKLFITRPKNPKSIVSPSNTVQMSPGRPNVNHILQNEVKEQAGAMCVTVCGPGSLADNVREAVRGEQGNGMIDFIEESFTW